MKPNGYQITESVPGFDTGDILNVTERFRGWHHSEMALELISESPGSKTVIVTDEPVGFSERDILDETARLGDWQDHARTFDAGGETLTDATATDGLVRIRSATLSAIAEPIDGDPAAA